MTSTPTLPRILLIDWDDEFALQLKEASHHMYSVEHLISAPELQQAVQIEPAPVAILLDIDTFRLGTETRLLDLRRLLPDVVYVLLSRAPQVMMELSLDLGPALMVHKDNSLSKLIDTITDLLPDHSTDTSEHLIEPMPHHNRGAVSSEIPFAQVITLQRQASIGVLGKNLGNELNNMNTVLMSVLSELQEIVTGVESAQSPIEQVGVLIQDLSWISENLKQYADSLVKLYNLHPSCVDNVDLKKHVVDMLSMLEGIGKTKYIGINPRLGQGDIIARISPGHLDHILHNLLVTISDAVANNHTTRRSVDITLVNDNERQLAQLSFHISAEFEHFRRIEQACAGEFTSTAMLAPYIAKRLVDANGGVMLLTPESHGGFSIHLEFPFQGSEDVTSPSMYHDQDVLDYDASYDEFIRESTQLK